MSGSRFHNFREGDRSEYLAVFFFSALGLVTTIPRQEDIGFDLVCSIADQEVGRLTFNHQYLVSVKSLSTPDIELLPAKSDEELEKTKTEESFAHIAWLFRNELTLLLAVVDGLEYRLPLCPRVNSLLRHGDCPRYRYTRDSPCTGRRGCFGLADSECFSRSCPRRSMDLGWNPFHRPTHLSG